MNVTKPKRTLSRRKLWLPGLIVVLGAALFFLYDAWRFEQQVAALTASHKKVLVIGHAGRAFFSPLNPFNPLPPNSRTSIIKALEEDGAAGLEIDVHVSKDGVPILYHDVTLETMTEGGRGQIENLPANQVLNLPFRGGWPYDLFHNEKIISLAELLTYLQKQPVAPYLHLDLRSYSPERSEFFARQILAVLEQYNYPLQKVSFVFPKVELLHVFRKLEPRATLLLDIDGNFEKALAIILRHQLHGLVADGKHINQEHVKKARQHGLQVVLFGGKARRTIYKMILLQPDAIEVNHPGAMRDMLRITD